MYEDRWTAMRDGNVIGTGKSPVTGIDYSHPVAQAYGENEGQQQYNAQLIASAPDLYEALSLFLTDYIELVQSGDAGNWDYNTDKVVTTARKALAKAEGK